MTNKVFKNFATIGIGTFISVAISAITTPIITKLVNPVDYGVYSIFISYSSIATTILCLGLDQAFVRFFYNEDSKTYKTNLLYKCVCFPIVLTIVVSVLLLNLVYDNILNFDLSKFETLVLCVYVLLSIISRFLLLLLRLDFSTKLYSFLTVIQKITFVLLSLLFLKYFDIKKSTILIVSITLSFLIQCIISILSKVEYLKNSCWEKQSLPLKELLKYSYPFIISMSITAIFQSADKFFIQYYCGIYDVGIYSAAMNIVHVFTIIQTTFNTLWSPMAIERFTKNPEDKEFHKIGNQIITVIMFAFGSTLIMFKNIFALLLGGEYIEAIYILPFLIFNPIMYTISETTVGGLVFMKKSKLQVFVGTIACITNVIGNIVLIPKFGCKGAAISTGLSYIVFFCARTFLSNKYYYIDFELKKFFIITCITIIYAAINTFFESLLFSFLSYIFLMSMLFIVYKETIYNIIDIIKKEIRNDQIKSTH